MPRNEPKRKLEKPAPKLARKAQGAKSAQERPVEELEKESRQASVNGRKAPQKIL